jgi:hypothetical protein
MRYAEIAIERYIRASCRWRDLLLSSGGLAVRVSTRQQIEHLAASSLPITELEVQSNERGDAATDIWSSNRASK